jgi:hypothetical protein
MLIVDDWMFLYQSIALVVSGHRTHIECYMSDTITAYNSLTLGLKDCVGLFFWNGQSLDVPGLTIKGLA